MEQEHILRIRSDYCVRAGVFPRSYTLLLMAIDEIKEYRCRTQGIGGHSLLLLIESAHSGRLYCDLDKSAFSEERGLLPDY